MVFDPLSMVFWRATPLSLVFWPTYPWYIDPPIHGNLTPLPMVYRTPYPWYFDPSAYLLIRNEGVKVPYKGAKYHGWKLTPESIYHGGQNTIRQRSFLHSSPITGFVTRLTRVPLVEQEQPTFPEFTPDFSGVCVTRSLVLCVCFVDHCLSFCHFLPLCCPSFDLQILITPLVSWNSS
jgi:hypothetical protein